MSAGVLRPTASTHWRISDRISCSSEWRSTIAASHLGVLARLGGHEAEAHAEKVQRLGEASRDAQPLPSALDDELARACRRRRSLDDAVGGRFMGVTEHRKQRHPIAMVDRIVAPHAALDMTAVEAEKLVQLGAGEKQRPLPRPIVAEGQHSRILSAPRYPS